MTFDEKNNSRKENGMTIDSMIEDCVAVNEAEDSDAGRGRQNNCILFGRGSQAYEMYGLRFLTSHKVMEVSLWATVYLDDLVDGIGIWVIWFDVSNPCRYEEVVVPGKLTIEKIQLMW